MSIKKEDLKEDLEVFIPKRNCYGKVVSFVCPDQAVANFAMACRMRNSEIILNVLHVNPDSADTVTQCYLSDVEEVCDQKFSLGMHVKSTLGGGFTGTVVGFELYDNRVICLSDAPSCQGNGSYNRVRYAYKVDELVESPRTFLFKLNKKYFINGCTKVRIVESSCPNQVALIIDEGSGKLRYTLETMEVDFKKLHQMGIASVTNA